MAKDDEIAEWVRISKDEPLHKKCKMIKCYETAGNSSHGLIIMVDTNEPDALSMLSRDFGNDWSLEIYPLHELHEVLEQDHSIIAG